MNDIKALIEQTEKLKQKVEQLKKKSFLTPVQSEAIKARKTGIDIALYLLRLSYTNEEECENNFGIVDSYFTLTGSLNSGQFAQNLGGRYADEKPERIEWYNPNKHTGLFARYDFDEKKFRHFLNQCTAKQRQRYWKKHIQPLIIQLDTDLTPWLPFMKPYIDTEGTQKAIKTAEPATLSDAIYEFKKIQKVVETEEKQESAGTGQSQQVEILSVIDLIEQIAKKLRTWADQNKKLIRNFSDSLTGPLPPMDYERVVAYLQGNSPDMAGPVQGHYEEVISCAKKIDALTADGSRSALETAASLVGELRFLANRLAQTLEVTAQNLTPEKAAGTDQEKKSEELLDSKIFNLARRRIKVKFAERQRALSEEVERIMGELGREGSARSSGAFKRVRDACDSEIDVKANIVWGSIQDVLNAVGSLLTNTLATALKQEVGYHIETIVEEISKYMIQRLPMSKSNAHYFDFENIKREVKEKFDVTIDLYVASLANEPAGIRPQIAASKVLQELREQFRNETRVYPELNHFVMVWPENKPKPEYPESYTDELINTNFCHKAWDTSGRRYKPKCQIWHCVVKPKYCEWDRLRAINPLKRLAEKAMEFAKDKVSQEIMNLSTPLDQWLLSIHELIGSKQIYLTYAMPAYYMKIDDVFAESAIACSILIDQLNKVKGSAKTGPEIIKTLGENERTEELTTIGPGKSNISGMPWQEAQKKAEVLVDEKEYLGFQKLAKAVGCSKGTLRKVIEEKSSKLRQAKEQYESTSKTLKAVGFTAKVIATYETSSGPKLSDTEADEILVEMLERIKRERPEMFESTKTTLDKMVPDGKRRFAAVYKRDYQNQKNALKKDGPKTQRQYKQV